MVYSTEQKPNRGQEFRDRVRCEAMDSMGKFRVYTLDDKHAEDDRIFEDRHCTANFADTNRMIKSMHRKWGFDVRFDAIILDYFFSPAGWAKVRWTENFFKNTLVRLASSDILNYGGSLWLPNVGHVDDMLTKFETLLSSHYDWSLVQNPDLNPLFDATNDVTAELLRAPDNMTNATQVRPLGDMPFYEFKRKPLNKKPLEQISPRSVGKVLKQKNSPVSKKGKMSSLKNTNISKKNNSVNVIIEKRTRSPLSRRTTALGLKLE